MSINFLLPIFMYYFLFRHFFIFYIMSTYLYHKLFYCQFPYHRKTIICYFLSTFRISFSVDIDSFSVDIDVLKQGWPEFFSRGPNLKILFLVRASKFENLRSNSTVYKHTKKLMFDNVTRIKHKFGSRCL